MESPRSPVLRTDILRAAPPGPLQQWLPQERLPRILQAQRLWRPPRLPSPSPPPTEKEESGERDAAR
ncbi:MAG: hypothetical protein HY558_08355 [Euryarchaeota archaeon]|nr:hypothetical protein [Euryarchaeota archaeon]